MKLLATAFAISLAFAAGCDQRPTTPPSPKTDMSSPPVPQAGTGSTSTPTTSSASGGAPTAGEKREGSNPVQGQVDPKQSEQRRDFKSNGDGKGPQSSDAQPTNK